MIIINKKEPIMKEYKRTYLASLPCFCLEMLIIIAPCALLGDIILGILGKTKPFEIISNYVAVGLLFMTVFIAMMALVSLIINAFKSPSVTVDGKYITYEGKRIDLDRVSYVTLHLPERHSRSNVTPQELMVYVNDDEDILIRRPSVFLVAHLKKRCANAKFGIADVRSRLIRDLIISACVAVICFVMAFVNK